MAAAQLNTFQQAPHAMLPRNPSQRPIIARPRRCQRRSRRHLRNRPKRNFLRSGGRQKRFQPAPQNPEPDAGAA